MNEHYLEFELTDTDVEVLFCVLARILDCFKIDICERELLSELLDWCKKEVSHDN